MNLRRGEQGQEERIGGSQGTGTPEEREDKASYIGA